VPDLLDTVELDAAPLRERGLGEARRDADPERAGDQFEQGPAPGRVERIEPGREMGADLGAAGAGEGRDDFGQRGRTLTHQSLRAWSPLSPRGVPWAGEGFAGAAFVPLSRTAGEGGARRVSGGRGRGF